ncbi:hypothetical protein OA339_01430 [Candidatus Pelagibacter sp.]|nr:hypothetical protein [Candidatus Pelagibacter sp.]
MLILGLNSHEINSSCAISKNGKLVYGSTEERFTRNKLTKEFPEDSINYFLKKNNLSIENFDYIGQSWNPAAYMIKYNPLKSKHRIMREDYFYTIPDNLLKLKKDNIRNTGRFSKLSFDVKKFPEIYFIHHHDCHAASSFFMSKFERSAVLICDYKGEFESTSFHLGRGNNLKKIKSFLMPNSLGMFYATITELLGYKPDQDEWKVMALSALKNKDKTFFKKMKKLYNICPNGVVNFNQEYFRGMNLSMPNLFTEKMVDLFGRKEFLKKRNFSDWHISVACALQNSAEEICVHYLKELYKITKTKKLSVGGGFFMNSVFNGKIIEKTPFDEVYIPYAPTDAGNSIGAAFYINHIIKNKPRINQKFYSQIGPTYTDDEILKVLKNRKIKFRISKDVGYDCAKLINENGYIAYFEGKSEFGDRALGNRSILGDPRKSSIKDEINKAIKYRESFRPFAPVTLQDKVSKYFDVSNKFSNNYMEKVIKVKNKFTSKLGAVTHFDNSARVQTVYKDSPNRLFNIILEFEKISNLPILLNTSFNVSGEPMVLTPADAINTFFKSGLKVLVLNKFIIIK